MHRMVRVGAAVAGTLVGLVAALIGGVYGVSSSRFSADLSAKAPKTSIAEDPDPDAVAKGQHLYTALLGCVHCHGEDAGGKVVVDDPAIGHVESANLTAALASYDLQTFARVVRHGIRSDGRPVIFMPSDGYVGVADVEVADVWAYLHTLPAVATTHPRPSPGPLARVLFLTGNMPILASAYVIDHDKAAPAAPPPTTDVVAYGGHLAEGCMGCHGKDLGGQAIPGAPPDWPHSANISPSDDGIGAWTEDDFTKTLRTGVNPKGTALREPMNVEGTKLLTDDEMHALWSFLRSKPGVPDNAATGKIVH